MIRKTLKLLHALRVDKPGIITRNEINVHPITNLALIRSLASHEKSKLKPEDQFGTLSESNFNIVEHEVEDDQKNEYFGKTDALRKMKICLKAHEYDNALELLRNIQNVEKAPTHAYKLLMSYNAKLGNVTEAFRLYNEYKKRGYYVRGAMYTSLFAACGNCQRSDIALPIAYKLAKYLFESKVHKPNLTNLHAMLKAFGRHGDISAAFQLVDRFNSRNAKVTTETYNMLIEACITDKASGLRFALLVWHYMLKRGLEPNLYTFTDIAKCCQSCSLGDSELVLGFVKMIVGEENTKKMNEQCEAVTASPSLKSSVESQMLESNQKTSLDSKHIYDNSYVSLENYTPSERIAFPDMLENDLQKTVDSQIEFQSNEVSCVESCRKTEQTKSVSSVVLCNRSNIASSKKIELPNLLDPKPTYGSVIDFDDMSKPQNRFLLFGGLKGFFKVMDQFNVKPDIKLFTILLYCIPATKEAEEELMTLINKYELKKDVRFINALLKIRISSNKNYTFQDCVDTLDTFKISPDLETIAVFASACRTREEGNKCIELTRIHKIRFSTKFLHALLLNATRKQDVDYLSDILTAAKEEGIELSAANIALLQSTLNDAKLQKLIEK